MNKRPIFLSTKLSFTEHVLTGVYSYNIYNSADGHDYSIADVTQKNCLATRNWA